jgi:hypothetical protein
MSAMSDLALEIELLVERGKSADFIANKLNVPKKWVYPIIDDYLAFKNDPDNSLPQTSFKLI